jgi:hypothetical protein
VPAARRFGFLARVKALQNPCSARQNAEQSGADKFVKTINSFLLKQLTPLAAKINSSFRDN